MLSQRFAAPTEIPGLAARHSVTDIPDGGRNEGRTFDNKQLDGHGAHPALKTLPDHDRALMRRLVATVLRPFGTLSHLLSRLLDNGVLADAATGAELASAQHRPDPVDRGPSRSPSPPRASTVRLKPCFPALAES